MFKSLNIKPKIKFIEMPLNLRDKYQYSTKADITKLRSIGYNYPFWDIEDAVEDYVLNYLSKKINFLKILLISINSLFIFFNL